MSAESNSETSVSYQKKEGMTTAKTLRSVFSWHTSFMFTIFVAFQIARWPARQTVTRWCCSSWVPPISAQYSTGPQVTWLPVQTAVWGYYWNMEWRRPGVRHTCVVTSVTTETTQDGRLAAHQGDPHLLKTEHAGQSGYIRLILKWIFVEVRPSKFTKKVPLPKSIGNNSTTPEFPSFGNIRWAEKQRLEKGLTTQNLTALKWI